MTALQEVLLTINNIKSKGDELSKNEIISILEATKSITKHIDFLNSLIFFFTTLNIKTNVLVETLTNRELQILKNVGHGKSTQNIAIKLSLSVSTVETHRKNIRKKLNLVGKNKLIEYAILYNLQYK